MAPTKLYSKSEEFYQTVQAKCSEYLLIIHAYGYICAMSSTDIKVNCLCANFVVKGKKLFFEKSTAHENLEEAIFQQIMHDSTLSRSVWVFVH